MPALYSDLLLDHFRNPRNFGSLPAPDITYEGFNPLCGDRIRIELKLRDDRVQAARFQGDGCAISLAAASMLTEMIAGSELTSVEVISNEQMLSLLKSKIQATRVRCALLPLEALRSGLLIYRERGRDWVSGLKY
jgi:nitrogen fixation NifU-like protein